MRSRSFVLVHSPLVGPSSWERVALHLRSLGHVAVVPPLPDPLTIEPPYWRAQAESLGAFIAASQLEESPFLVAHSGAGPLLPYVEMGDRPAGYLFADAALPIAGQSRLDSLPADLQGTLLGMANDGLLPPWPDWWPAEVLERLLPDPALRAAFTRECPHIPLALFEETLPAFPGWPDAPAGYLRLSEAYRAEEAEAAQRGWPVAALKGSHLDLLTRPDEVAEALLGLAALLEKASG